MLEIEVKCPVADFDGVRQRLTEWGAVAEEPIEEADHYYNAPDRDFARTDEAFRLRCVGVANRLTYKGPRQAGPAKTRTEIEVGLASGAEAAALLGQLVERLGYRPVAVVRKWRTCYHVRRDGHDLHVSCDDVEAVGRFVEVEIVAPEDDKARAEAVLLAAAQALGLGPTERRSYLEMLLERRGESIV